VTNANVEKKQKEKKHPKTNHTLKVTITKNKISIREQKSFYKYYTDIWEGRIIVITTDGIRSLYQFK